MPCQDLQAFLAETITHCVLLRKEGRQIARY